VLAQPTPPLDEAHRTLLRASAAALGVGTEQWLRDYFRLAPAPDKVALAELVEAGELLPITVAGVRRPAYLWHQARVPRRVEASALLSPFDSLIFERERTEQLFDYRFRIEIYVPAEKRVHGYYVFTPSWLTSRSSREWTSRPTGRATCCGVMAAYAEPRGAGRQPPNGCCASSCRWRSGSGWRV